MTTETQSKAGRPEVEIDWKKVDFLIEAGCNGSEIAAQLGVHYDTLSRRIQDNYNENFTEYAAKKRQKGDSNIRVVQYQKALKGDNSMLIWLGKDRLKQRDKEKDEPDSLTNDLASLVKLLLEGKITQPEHVTNK